MTAASTSHAAEAANPSRSPARRGLSHAIKDETLPDDLSSKVVVTDDINILYADFNLSIGLAVAGGLIVPFAPFGIKKIVKLRDVVCNHKFEFLSFVLY